MTGQASGAWRGLSLLAVLVLLAGCATPEVRPAANTHAVTLPAPAASAAAPEVALEPPPAPDFWSQLRAGFAFARCVDDPLVTPWLRRYSAHPDRLEASLSRALPRLRYIAEVLHGAGIPGEFALLPWVESSFRVLPARGDGPAGLWQIMPRTGRDLGLRIDHRYDGRLDLEQSTLAAAALLQRYDDAFGDWRLADLAYNTGMYRVKKLLAGLDAPLRADAVVPDIGVSDTTRDHLAKLMAITCLIKQPERYQVRLPDPADNTLLVRTRLPAPLPIPLAARLANASEDSVRDYNAAYLDPELPARTILLPAQESLRFTRAYAELVQRGWTLWQRVELRQSAQLTRLVDDAAGSELLAHINRLHGANQPTAKNQRLWLPANLAAALPADMAVAVSSQPRSHRVVAGDNLWDLARRFKVSVANIKRWNGLRRDMLHLGQTLRLEPPDDLPTMPIKALN